MFKSYKDIKHLNRRCWKHGFYLINGQICLTNKAETLELATKLKTRDVRYCVEDDIFSTIDWTIEPEQSLPDLYRIRAQQIRDEYDYVIITYSGGSDSYTALHSFFANGILPDEVATVGCFAKGFTDFNTETNLEAAVSTKKWIKEWVIPNGVKYYRHDISEDTKKMIKDESWIYESSTEMVAFNTARTKLFDHPRYQKMVDEGKKVCIILGLEKPQMYYDGNEFYVYFNDLNQHDGFFRDINTLGDDVAIPDVVRFFTAGNFPLLTIKQSHVIKEFYKKNYSKEQLKTLLTFDKSFDYKTFKKIATELLYKDIWDPTTFSRGKIHAPLDLYFRDDWIRNNKEHERIYTVMKEGWKYIDKTVDSYFFKDPEVGLKSGLHGILSRSYNLGK